jgi:hypothetical protein
VLLGMALSVSSSAAATTACDPHGDWDHVLQVVANLKAQPPTEPVVLLLGGSAARECTVSDASWASQIEAKRGPVTRVFNLGSRNRTLAKNIALVRELPRVPMIIYIGVNVGAFCSPTTSVTVRLPEPTATVPPYLQHPYSRNDVLSDAEKARLARRWMRDRYRYFRRNHLSCTRVLSRLIDVCHRRGYTPVLFELPRNTVALRHRLDEPVRRYRATCRALAKKKHIPFVSLVREAALPDSAFFDLWHLVEPGRVVWQDLLSDRTLRHLDRYGLSSVR